MLYRFTKIYTIMKALTYNHIKSEIRRFTDVVTRVADYWEGPFPGYTMVAVLLQNMSSKSSVSDQEEDEMKMRDILRILQEMRDYHKSYFYDWVYDEVSSIYEGNTMSEECDEMD